MTTIGFPFHWVYLLGMLVCLGVPVLVVVGVLAFRYQPPQAGAYASPPGAPPPPAQPAPPAAQGPREILDRRFASGEITAEEYQKARDLLEGRPPPSA